jgi:cytoskeletal protein CcmA (bactofilin family)
MLIPTLDQVPLVDPAVAATKLPKLPSSSPQAQTPAARVPGNDDWEYSVVNERLVLRGDLESEDDILVKGRVYGNIRCKLLIIDKGALVEGAITAQDVVVRGSTKGSILANRVRLERTANVASDVYHASFSAEEGARMHGALAYAEAPLDAFASDLQDDPEIWGAGH